VITHGASSATAARARRSKRTASSRPCTAAGDNTQPRQCAASTSVPAKARQQGHTVIAVRGEHHGAGRKRTALAVRGEHLGAGQSTATRTHGHSSARRAQRCRPEGRTAITVRGEHHSAGQSHRCGGRNVRTARAHRSRQSATHGSSSARRAPRCRPGRHRCGGGTSRRRAPPGRGSRRSTA
jgi:hypothetical protein